MLRTVSNLNEKTLTASDSFKVGDVVKVLVDYHANGNGELSVKKGEAVTIREVKSDTYRVKKQSAEGWIPSYTLNLLRNNHVLSPPQRSMTSSLSSSSITTSGNKSTNYIFLK